MENIVVLNVVRQPGDGVGCRLAARAVGRLENLLAFCSSYLIMAGNNTVSLHYPQKPPLQEKIL